MQANRDAVLHCGWVRSNASLKWCNSKYRLKQMFDCGWVHRSHDHQFSKFSKNWIKMSKMLDTACLFCCLAVSDDGNQERIEKLERDVWKRRPSGRFLVFILGGQSASTGRHDETGTSKDQLLHTEIEIRTQRDETGRKRVMPRRH